MNVNFVDYEPPQRFDGVPWNRARIEEAAASTGTWSVIDTKTLSPLDTDPENPQSRNFTTNLAALVDGWYRIVFLDADNNEAPPTAPVQYLGGLADRIRPTVRELGELMGGRTYNEFSNKLGEFNDNTTPTADQADTKIDRATQIVLIKVGSGVSERHYDLCREAIIFKAAALVELSYYPEQANNANSNYELYQAQYDEIMGSLITALRDQSASSPARLVSVPMVGATGYVPLSLNINYGDVDELLA